MIDVPELLAQSIEDRSIEAAVLCLEGCGTSIINDPSVMRRVGKLIIGRDSTEPVIENISAVGEDNILDPDGCKVDNVEGLCVAYDAGVHRAATSTGSLKEAQMMRDMFGSDLLIIGLFDDYDDSKKKDYEGLADIIVSRNRVEPISPSGREFLNNN